MVATTARESSAAFLSVAVTSINRFDVLEDTVVRAELIIGGNEIVLSLASKIIGTLGELFKIEPYCFPASVFSKISDMVISCDESSGINLWFFATVVYLIGNSIFSKSCIPIEAFLRLLPIPKCRSS